MTTDRSITAVNDLQPMFDDARRQASAAIAPGLWDRHDPFLSMMNDRFRQDVFAPHPHRGFETLTYVLEGTLSHRDSQGGHGRLEAGDAQWMTAGRGVVHDEQPADADVPLHVLQLWINLPARDKFVTSRYQDLRGAQMPVRREPGVQARVFSGRSGEVQGPALNHVPITLIDIRMEAGATFTQALDGGDRAFVYVISGAGRFGADDVLGHATQTLWLDPTQVGDPSTLRLHATEPLHALFMSGRPLREPVVARGPFVMNTAQQIDEAIHDFQSGRFGR